MVGSLVHALAPLLHALTQDPVLAYCLLAAALLALVSVGTGLLRGDLAVLFRPGLLLRVVTAVVLAFALWLGAALLQRHLPAGPALEALAGLSRFPLYLVTLAYGPGVGLVAGALFAGLQAGGGVPGLTGAVLVLELVVLGWLAIYPSPRNRRWAGPFDAVLAYALTWGTAGLALLESRQGAVTPAGLWAQHQHVLLGVALSALLLALVSPGAYRRAFPGSRIAPDPSSVPAGARGTERERARSGGRDPMTLTHPDLPRALRRGRDRRELEPIPNLPSDGDRDGD
ncbi:MAG TPA: hypothetical protein VKA00_08235 [Trueperaceae bacterium]|nr:hypothetical protein [Trueperaceae bacterium]